MHSCMAYFKTILFIAVLFSGTMADAQSLKEALYSGRLKTDSGSVIKKGDSLQVRTNEEVKAHQDSLKIAAMVAKVVEDSLKKAGVAVNTVTGEVVENRVDSTGTMIPVEKLDNTAAWKKFIDEYTAVVKKEVDASNRVRKGAYSVLIEYEIGEDGSIVTNTIAAEPKNAFIEEQVKQRMMYNAPQLDPVRNANGTPRKVSRKQMLTIIKE